MSEPDAPRIVVVGSVNLDLSARVAHLPRPGETVVGDSTERGGGGKGANQAVAAARLGARTTFVGLVGADAIGTELLDGLRADNVDVSHAGTAADAPSGLALILVEASGENMITISPGANDLLRPSRLTELPELFADADAVLLQLEVPVETTLAAARLAHGAGVTVVLNAAPSPGPPGDTLTELLGLVDVLIVNETEAAALSGVPATDPLAAALALRAFGPEQVVVTLGEHGAALAGGGGATTVPAFAVAAVDTVGAGDAFCAELAFARCAGADPVEAVRRACAAGALATTRPGARAALPGRAEVDQFLASAATNGLHQASITPRC